jgi:hypothetical protein
MADIEHKNIANANLHEPKDVSTANAGDTYVADGLGSGSWTAANALTKLSTSTPSGSTDEFTSLMDASTYASYLFELKNITTVFPAGATSLYIEVSSDNGTSWNATTGRPQIKSDGATVAPSTTTTLGFVRSTGNGETFGFVKVFPESGQCRIYYEIIDGDDAMTSGWLSTTLTVNAIRFGVGLENFSGGEISMYGLKP